MFEILCMIALALVVVIGAFALCSLIFMLVVNWVLVLFGIAFSITFIQSFGLVLLIWCVGQIFNISYTISMSRQ